MGTASGFFGRRLPSAHAHQVTQPSGPPSGSQLRSERRNLQSRPPSEVWCPLVTAKSWRHLTWASERCTARRTPGPSRGHQEAGGWAARALAELGCGAGRRGPEPGQQGLTARAAGVHGLCGLSAGWLWGPWVLASRTACPALGSGAWCWFGGTSTGAGDLYPSRGLPRPGGLGSSGSEWGRRRRSWSVGYMARTQRDSDGTIMSLSPQVPQKDKTAPGLQNPSLIRGSETPPRSLVKSRSRTHSQSEGL